MTKLRKPISLSTVDKRFSIWHIRVMGKRSDFEKIDKDQYLTPEAAVRPLIPFLPKGGFTFAEPCAGDGRLTDHIVKLTNGNCRLQQDIAPEQVLEMIRAKDWKVWNEDVSQGDAFDITEADLKDIDMIITNPPWSRAKKDDYILHKLITHFASMRPTWFLFDTDWAHTVQAQPFLETYCTRIVSIGRAKWMEDTNQSGKDNCAWYEFHPYARRISSAPKFYGRGVKP